ncbi:hypothetical protein [Rhodopila sp.]|uniref:hypothetical protein n=1 Tax=Rhodopila sp. TaxID=2480087 RepID=UPI003D12F7A2
MSDVTTETTPPYDPHAIFDENGPINPSFVAEAIRTLMRALPIDRAESADWANRRRHSAMLALAALHPRDEIEVMIGVQALCAYHAAAACWRLGMNHHHPCGDSTRHIATAASAARAFDSLLRGLERRQIKPLTVPLGRPAPRKWNRQDPTSYMEAWETRCRDAEGASLAETPAVAWNPRAIALANELREADRIAVENEGLDIEHTDGILPGGGMIMPEHPTPQQEAYMARRLGLAYRRECQENLRRGLRQYPPIRHIRPGDLIL